MNFQQRLIAALVAILAVQLGGYWVSAFLHIDTSTGPDPSAVILELTGLIGSVWGTGELIAQRREAKKKQKDDTEDDEPVR